MTDFQVTDPVEYINTLGGLHDAWIHRIFFDVSKQELSLGFDDLNANFEGLPEYPGVDPGELVFHGITKFYTNLDLEDEIRVSAARVSTEDSMFRIEMDLSSGAAEFGGCSIIVCFTTLAKKSA